MARSVSEPQQLTTISQKVQNHMAAKNNVIIWRLAARMAWDRRERDLEIGAELFEKDLRFCFSGHGMLSAIEPPHPSR